MVWWDQFARREFAIEHDTEGRACLMHLWTLSERGPLSSLHVHAIPAEIRQSWHGRCLIMCKNSAVVRGTATGHAFSSVPGRAPALQQKCVFAALLRFQLFWSLVPAAVRSTDACLTPVRPTIVLRSHLRSCKDLAGKGWKPGRHARGGTDQNVYFVLWGLRLHPAALLTACVTSDTTTVNCTLGVWNHRCTCHSSVIKGIYLNSARTSARL